METFTIQKYAFDTMGIYDLMDIQRVRYPNLNVYSYVSKALNVKSRLDFLLITKSFSKYVRKVGTCPSIASDHKIIYLNLSLPHNTKRGPGFWKFNNTLLNDEEYAFKIRELVPRLREKYANLEEKRLVWELIKMEIRENTISFAKRKARALSLREEEISKRLEELDETICNSTNLLNIDHILKEYDTLKTEINSIYENKGKAAIFRSKCRWVEEGERPTKYFFNLEKQNYSRKTVTELRSEGNEIVYDEQVILKSTAIFYEDLYSSKETMSQADFDSFTSDLDLPKLSDTYQEIMEGLLSFEECKKVLEISFKDNKSPGEDGFTAEFYKHFFDLIGADLVESFNKAFEYEELSISQRRGVIALIPKQESDFLDLQNWSPITLLNIHYKIAAKALAKRIEVVLPKLVNADQTGFIKGRHIGENIRLISDLMDYTKEGNLPGILMPIDFKKAFDTLEWSYIRKVLELLNFGEGVKRWIGTFYTNIETAVLNNGFATNWFKPSRGVRQGCPLSSYLFVLGAEILASKIRQNPLVKGIDLFGNETKIIPTYSVLILPLWRTPLLP